MATAPGRRLRERIRADGPLPWRTFMDVALYDADGGFYAKGRHPAGIGTGTHFATSPTLHPFFSHCVARELAKEWKAAGSPPAWEVVEFGAGTGALARDAMNEMRRLNVPARWTAIDVREGPAIKGGRWRAKPPQAYDAVVANEFLDALAFDILEWHADAQQWLGLGVQLKDDKFAWTALAPVEAQPPAGREDGDWLIQMPANEPWLKSVAAAGIKCAVIIDYGELHPAHEVRAFFGHEFADPLAEPGTVDLTADVDFEELGQQSAALGFLTKVETQEAFLLRHGVFEALNKIDRTTREGASAYLRLRQLLLPTGFGAAFKVACLTKNLQATSSPA